MRILTEMVFSWKPVTPIIILHTPIISVTFTIIFFFVQHIVTLHQLFLDARHELWWRRRFIMTEITKRLINLGI